MSRLDELYKQEIDLKRELAKIQTDISYEKYQDVFNKIKSDKYYCVNIGNHDYMFFPGSTQQRTADNVIMLFDVVRLTLTMTCETFVIHSSYAAQAQEIKSWNLYEISKKEYIEHLSRAIETLDKILKKEIKGE